MSDNENLPVVFLIGAGRSGTTLLYKTVALHKDVAYLSNHHNRYSSVLVASSIERLVNGRPELKRKCWFRDDGSANFNRAREFYFKFIPQPAECEAVYGRCGVPFTLADVQVPSEESRRCLRRTFKEILRYTGGLVLLSKRTANNRRIDYLRSVFPEAKFVHLVRDGRAVAYSLLRVRWWADHLLFWSGKSPAEMGALGHEQLELAARNWVEEMTFIANGLAGIDANQVYELRYEDFLSQPLDELSGLLKFLGVTATDEEFSASVSALALKPENMSWMKAWSDDQQRKVLTIQEHLLKQAGYIK